MLDEIHPPFPPDNASITRLVHGFYADVRADPLLGPVFDGAIGARWDAHLARMVDFWCTVALGARRYRGDVFAPHMRLQGVTPAHFAAWTRLWARHTEDLFDADTARQLQQAAHGIARKLFHGYFGQRPDFEAPHDGHGH